MDKLVHSQAWQAYPGLPPIVEMTPEVKTSLVEKIQKCPMDCQYVFGLEMVESFAILYIQKEAGAGP